MAETLYATSTVISGTCTTPSAFASAPNGIFTGDTGNTNWTCRWALGQPVGTLSGTQTLVVTVRKTPGQTGNPTLNTINFYDGSGTIVATAAGGSVTSGTSQTFQLQFDASVITNTTSYSIELITTGVGGAGGVRASVQADAVVWTANVEPAVTPKAASETATVSVTESAAVVISASIAASDTATVSVSESTTLDESSSFPASDTATVSVSENWELLIGEGSGGSTPPNLVAVYSAGWTGHNPTTLSVGITYQAGDVLTMVWQNENINRDAGTPNNLTGLTWVLDWNYASTAANTIVKAWHAVATQNGSGTISLTETGATVNYRSGFEITRWNNSDGYGGSAHVDNRVGTDPSINYTTTQANSALVWFNGDWQSIIGTTRAWNTINGQSYVELDAPAGYRYWDGATATFYAGYWPDAGAVGAKTAIQTDPNGMYPAAILFEIKGTTGTPTYTNIKNASETANVSVSESTAVDTGASVNPVAASDTATVSVTESASILVVPPGSDTATVSVTESALIVGTVVASDTATVSVSESASNGQSLTIVEENALTAGVAGSAFWLQYPGEDIPAFTRSTFYAPGDTMQLSVDYNTAYTVEIWRLGWYGGAGNARKITEFAGNPTSQPAPATIANSNGAVTCAAWSITDTWAVPADATPGWYWILLRNGSDTQFAGIPFVVSDANAKKPVVVVSSEATWHAAYNGYGGNNVYGASTGIGSITDRALCSTYDKPVVTRDNVTQTHFTNGELAQVRWMERMGFEVGYTTCEQIDADPTILDGRSLIVFSGHNEYISQRIRDKVVERIGAGVNIANFAANDFFWRTCYGDTTGFTHGQHNGRVMWCKKDSMDGPTGTGHTGGDPFTTQADWMGTWQDTRWTSAAGTTELFGDRFIANGIRSDNVKVPFAYKTLPIWRDCSAIQALTSGQTHTFGAGTAGMEWDKIETTLPSVALSESTVDLTGNASDINGQYYNTNGTYDHQFQMVKNGSAYIFNANTTQWGWALDNTHDRGSAIAEADAQQATLNVLYDLGATGDTASITAASLTEPTPVADIAVAYGLPVTTPVSASDTATVSVTESASVVPSGGDTPLGADTATISVTESTDIQTSGGGTSTEHTIFSGEPGVAPGAFFDGTPSIITGDAFYRFDATTAGWRVIGCRIWIPATATALHGQTITGMLYTTGYAPNTLPDLSTAPITTGTAVTGTDGWTNIYFDTPYTPDIAINEVVWVATRFEGTPEAYVYAQPPNGNSQISYDGSQIYRAENNLGGGGQARPIFRIGTGATVVGSNSYGHDIIFDEGAPSSTPIAGSDTATVSVSEATDIQIEATVTASDTATVSVTESVDILVIPPGSDTAIVSVTESVSIFATTDAVDTANISGVGASVVQQTALIVETSDVATISTTESSEVLVIVDVADTAGPSVGESVTGSSNLNTTDTATISATGIGGITITGNNPSTTDVASITVAEVASIFVTEPGSETAIIAVAEVASIFAATDASDTVTVSTTESSAFGGTQSTATETATVTVTEFVDVTITSQNKAAVDTATVSISEAVSILVTVDTADAASIATIESGYNTIEITAADSVSLSTIESSSVSSDVPFDVQVWNGTSLILSGQVQYWNGTQLVPVAINEPLVWDGTQFVAYDGGGTVNPVIASETATVSVTENSSVNPSGTITHGYYLTTADVGVPAGTSLTPSGGITATTPGAVYDALDISGGFTCDVGAGNTVTLKRSKVSGSNSPSCVVSVSSGILVMEDVEVDGTGVENGVGFDNYTATRCHVHSFTGGDGFKAGDNTTIEYCYIRPGVSQSQDHSDGVQMQGSGNGLTIRYCNIDISSTAYPGVAIILAPDLGPNSDGPIRLTSNYLDGGGWIMTVGTGNNGQYYNHDVVVTDQWYGRNALFGPENIENDPKVQCTITGSLWADTQQPI